MGNPKAVLDHEPEAVEYARRKAGLTVTDVARELGVSVSLISQIESGNRNATPAMINRLAEVFNCPVVVLERKRYAPERAPAEDAA
jgi:transcriptional regulator with XRE-family HTH domain